jgi:molybdopterin-guanine dinucleotide biosynthesis protein
LVNIIAVEYKEPLIVKKKSNVLRIRIMRGLKVPSQKEFDDLLMSVDDYEKLSIKDKIIHRIKSLFFRRYDWYLVISFKGKEYKYKIIGDKKEKRIILSDDIEKEEMSEEDKDALYEYFEDIVNSNSVESCEEK